MSILLIYIAICLVTNWIQKVNGAFNCAPLDFPKILGGIDSDIIIDVADWDITDVENAIAIAGTEIKYNTDNTILSTKKFISF